MRVIIAGAGEIGRGVAAALRQESRSVALIDPNPTAIIESQSLDCLLITGSALSRESLLRAGISDAEIVVLATNDDETNLLGCACLLYTSPSPRDVEESRMPSSA